MSDPASYRTKDELEKYRLDDPIIRLRAQLTREGKLTHEHFDQLDKTAKKIVADSVKFAEESPDPPLEELYAYTYAMGAAEMGPSQPAGREEKRSDDKERKQSDGRDEKQPKAAAPATTGATE